VAKAPFQRVLFLGSGSHFAGAREAAFKMLEMTAGRVSTMCESYLGLRHGPNELRAPRHSGDVLLVFRSDAAGLRNRPVG